MAGRNPLPYRFRGERSEREGRMSTTGNQEDLSKQAESRHGTHGEKLLSIDLPPPGIFTACSKPLRRCDGRGGPLRSYWFETLTWRRKGPASHQNPESSHDGANTFAPSYSTLSGKDRKSRSPLDNLSQLSESPLPNQGASARMWLSNPTSAA